MSLKNFIIENWDVCSHSLTENEVFDFVAIGWVVRVVITFDLNGFSSSLQSLIYIGISEFCCVGFFFFNSKTNRDNYFSNHQCSNWFLCREISVCFFSNILFVSRFFFDSARSQYDLNMESIYLIWKLSLKYFAFDVEYVRSGICISSEIGLI